MGKLFRLTIGSLILLLGLIVTGEATFIANGGDIGLSGVADQPGDALLTWNISGTTFYLATNVTGIEITSGTFIFNTSGGQVENEITLVTVPPQSVGYDVYVFISTDPIHEHYLVNPLNILTADAAIPSNYAAIPGAIVEIALQDEHHNWILNPTLVKNAEIRLKFADTDNNGYVDGMTARIKTSDLGIYCLDENTRTWTEVGGSEVSTAGQYVSAQVNHFSVYTLLGKKAPANLNETIVYPIPYRPNSGTKFDNPAGIVFDHVPDYLEIRIFNIAGELVFNDISDSTGGRYIWKAINNGGEKVASGVYIFILHDHSGNKKTGKLTIIK